jgi:hypothetical protein
MTQTFSNWNDVPTAIEAKIQKMWNGCGTVCYKNSTDNSGKPIDVYTLADWKVFGNEEYLTQKQKNRLFDLAIEHPIILKDFLQKVNFGMECVRVNDEVYYIPGLIFGTWPHCNLYGGMDESGYIYT